MRKSSNALKFGNYIEEIVTNRQFVFSRNYQNEKVLVICNSDFKSAKIQLNLNCDKYEDMFSGQIYSAEEMKQFEIGECNVKFLKGVSR